MKLGELTYINDNFYRLNALQYLGEAKKNYVQKLLFHGLCFDQLKYINLNFSSSVFNPVVEFSLTG